MKVSGPDKIIPFGVVAADVSSGRAMVRSPQRRPRLLQKPPSDILTLQSKGHLNLVATGPAAGQYGAVKGPIVRGGLAGGRRLTPSHSDLDRSISAKNRSALRTCQRIVVTIPWAVIKKNSSTLKNLIE
jgi:hypothetical protein